MKYKLIAFDIDGTLLNKDGDIPPAMVDAIQQAMAQGIQVTLATGRMFRSAARYAQKLGIHIPIICYQGSLVADPTSGHILLHTPMSIEAAREAIEVAHQVSVHLNLYIDDELYVEEITDGVKRYAERNNAEAHLVPNLADCIEKEPTKIMAWGQPELIGQVYTHLTNKLGARFLITRSYPTLCEIGHPDTGKGVALKSLASLLGVEQAETVAVGDGPNDLDMIEWAGLGVAVDTAPDEVKAKADWVASISPEDGLASLLTRLLND